ncbi:MAG: hypothetical protein NT118_09260, partial [Lentisphaerae bacterium]|nr:hypothetical protein [Lentisphaerota bacterium]
MNRIICVMLLGVVFAISGTVFAEDNVNLLKNSELKLDSKGQLPNWETWVKCKFTQDAGHKGQNSVRMTLEAGDDVNANSRIVLYQTIDNLKPGKY